MSRATFAVLLLAALSACAAPSVAVKKGFDLSRSGRVAVIGFRDYPGRRGSGEIVAGAFEQALLARGWDVVERDQVKELLGERRFGGRLGAERAKRLGAKLGVDALVYGRVTDLAVPREAFVRGASVSERVEPLYRRREDRVRRPDGTWVNEDREIFTGWRRTRVVRNDPRAVDVEGRLGVSARMVSASDGSVLWSGSEAVDASSFADAADDLASSILKAVAARR